MAAQTKDINTGVGENADHGHNQASSSHGFICLMTIIYLL